MKLQSIDSKRTAICQALQQCRSQTLALFSDIDDQTFRQQAHPDFSPVGWHLGHLAFTEAYWILERFAGKQTLFPEYQKLFAADGLPKESRQNLPTIDTIQDYLQTVRKQILAYLEVAPLEKEERFWRWLIQHESQHSETISFVLELHRFHLTANQASFSFPNSLSPVKKIAPKTVFNREMIAIPAGDFLMGSNAIEAQDNERPTYTVYLDKYWLDPYPVTYGEYRQFIKAGGYQKAEFWSEKGWKWLQENPVAQPLYWREETIWDNHPVCGVSYYEAEAYANFVGKRLPTEAEWEKAASWNPITKQKSAYPWGNEEPTAKFSNHNNLFGQTTPVNQYPAGKSSLGCYDLLGNVWEWTATWFTGYQGFQSYPYRGYSQVYFDGEHRVLKGGSWATRPWGLRNSFRNWYHPHVRQILAGFRCARSN
ncbi:MAG: ergothioneine biosynthesis protein EgtB [Oscillatoria sp. PMC 1068.18]|nr:ergothioneine biosynthesis protein EgtB [Oscillatoria sp. PMC 1076.18]MEC4990363.1 ergothioneine biosynthesis protein EgtB [Oscillatoria sp. PMC 1068.18]